MLCLSFFDEKEKERRRTSEGRKESIGLVCVYERKSHDIIQAPVRNGNNCSEVTNDVYFVNSLIF